MDVVDWAKAGAHAVSSVLQSTVGKNCANKEQKSCLDGSFNWVCEARFPT